MDCLIALAEDGSDEKDDLIQMRSNIESVIPQQDIQGNKYFWKSDYVCHHERNPDQTYNYFSTVKMCSSRTLGTESITGDNLKGYWLPYGCSFLYRNGNEYIRLDPNNSNPDPTDADDYVNIFPYWDWEKVPGVTCPNLLPDLEDVDETEQTQNASFVGTANNADYGVTAMSLDKDYLGGNVSAKKAWFHFGAEIIALGADITGSGLHTTINQTLLDLGNGVTTEQSQNPGPQGWIQHDNVAYIFPDQPIVEYTDGFQSGIWDDINEGETQAVIPHEVFKAWIDHNAQIDPTSYYYIIAPNQNAASYNNQITVLEPNNDEILAVKKDANPDLAGIIYFPDNFAAAFVDVGETGNSLEFQTDTPCALLYDESDHEVCLSSPDRSEDVVVLTIKVNSDDEGNITFTLPRGHEAGTSLCQEISGFTVSQSCSSSPPMLQLNAVFDYNGLEHTWIINGETIVQNTPVLDYSFPTPFSEEEYSIVHQMELNGEIILSTETVYVFAVDHPNGLTLPGGSFGNPEITTWDESTVGTSVIISGTLTVPQFAEFIIAPEVTVMFCGEDSKMAIEQGGKVTLSGKLTDFEDQTWKGVEVWGNPNASQATIFGTNAQGRFFGEPGSVIENADIGIQSWGPNLNDTGGVIDCDGTTFYNNERGVAFRPYQYGTDPYEGVFNKCTFEIDKYFLGPRCITMSGVEGVQILGCTFNNNLPTYAGHLNIGIEAFDASFDVLPSPDDETPNTFNRISFGIFAHKLTNNKPFTVREALFDNCVTGIKNAGVNGSTILYNEFRLGNMEFDDGAALNQSGITFTGTITDFICQENTFASQRRDDNTTIGIFCNNTGTMSKTIRRNKFTSLTVGNLVNRENGVAAAISTGLTYLCNENTNAELYDIDVAPNSLVHRQQQGESNQGAGNTFSDPNQIINIINTGLDDQLLYRHHIAVTPPSTDGNVTLAPDGIENDCEVEYQFLPEDDDCFDMAEVTINYNNAKSGYTYAVSSSGPSTQVSKYRAEMDKYASQALRILMEKEDCYDRDSLLTWIQRLERVEGELWRSSEYLSDGNVQEATQILDAIPTKFTLSQGTQSDVNNYKSVTQLIGTEPVYQLSASTQQSIANYSEAGGFTQEWVKSILAHYGAEYPTEYVISEAREREEKTDKESAAQRILKVYPNPANDIVNFEFIDAMSEKEITLLVSDLSGKLIASFTTLDRSVIQWNTTSVPTGIYFYQVWTEGKVQNAGKVVLVK